MLLPLQRLTRLQDLWFSVRAETRDVCATLAPLTALRVLRHHGNLTDCLRYIKLARPDLLIILETSGHRFLMPQTLVDQQ